MTADGDEPAQVISELAVGRGWLTGGIRGVAAVL
jgi:hypothetical protein